jgi:hypothetical protein
MLEADGCTASKLEYRPDDKSKPHERLERVSYGQETRYPPPTPGERCHDCNVQPGRYHHSGCDWEECPRCHRQVISCPCNDEGQFSDIIPDPDRDGGAR